MKRDRITFEGNFCEIARCLETPGGSFCEDGTCSQRRVWERLKEYEDLEEAGLIMRLPCKLGGKCYDILEGEVYENNSDYIGISLDKAKGGVWFTIDDMEVRPKNFGKIFGTKEEAEAALRKENLLEEDSDTV